MGAASRSQLAAVTKILPPYALTYDPNSIKQLGKVFQQGLSGAGGGYYGPQYPVQP